MRHGEFRPFGQKFEILDDVHKILGRLDELLESGYDENRAQKNAHDK